MVPVENPKLVILDHPNGQKLHWFYCPGCKHGHPFEVPRWSFDGDLAQPTYSPSLRMFYTRDKQEITTCHLHVKKGMIEFCDDCPHELRGKTVPMADWPEGYHKPGDPA
jgi:hypothetical protein